APRRAALRRAARAHGRGRRAGRARGVRRGARADRGPGREPRGRRPPSLGGDGAEPGVRAVFDEALARIEDLGGSLEEVALPHSPHGIAAYYVLAPAEASANLARYDGVRYATRATDKDLLSMYEETRAAGFGDEVKRRIMLGTYA